MRLQGFNAQHKRAKEKRKQEQTIAQSNAQRVNAIMDLQQDLDNLEKHHEASNQSHQSPRSSDERLSSGEHHHRHNQSPDMGTKDVNQLVGLVGLGITSATGGLHGSEVSVDDSSARRKRNDKSDVSPDRGGNSLLDPNSLTPKDQQKSEPRRDSKLLEATRSPSGKDSTLGKTQIVKIGGKEIALADGEFQVGGRIIKRVPKALYCCTSSNPFRNFSAQISEHRAFDNLIILFIFINCICMASRDYIDKNDESMRNKILNYIDFGFSGVFIVEAILKIVTSGFIFGKKTYLRDPWNVIDFLIVLAAILDIFMAAIQMENEALSALKSLRVLRVLRPLKAVKTLPSLRKQVAALLKSLKQLANVLVFLLAMLILGGVMGLQLFMKSVHYGCRVTKEPLPGASVWEKAPDSQICSPSGDNDWDSYAGYACPEGTYCGSPLDYGLPPDADIQNDVTVQYGFAIFSDIFDSIFTVFQIITMDNWSAIMYNNAYAQSFWMPSFFATSIVFLGSFFLLNLMLAVIMDSYDQCSSSLDEIHRQQLEEEKREVEERIANTASMTQYQEINDLLQQRQERIMNVFKDKFRQDILRIKKEVDPPGGGSLGSQIDPNYGRHIPENSNSNANPAVAPSKDEVLDDSQESSQNDFKELDKEILGHQQLGKSASGGSSLMMKNFGSSLLSSSLGGGQQKAQPQRKQAQQPSSSATQVVKKETVTDGNVPIAKTKTQGEKLKLSIFASIGQKQERLSEPDPTALISDKSNKPLKPEDSSSDSSEDEFSDNQKLVRLQTKQISLLKKAQTIENAPRQQYSMMKSQSASNLMLKIGQSLLHKVHNKQKELEELQSRTKSLREPQAKDALQGIHTRAVAAVNLKNLDDKYKASNQIRLEGNLMMLKFKEALKEKYLPGKGAQSYGLKDEGSTMHVLRSNINQSINSYKQSISRQISKPSGLSQDNSKINNSTQSAPSSNPLAAVFAAVQAKKEAEARELAEKNGETQPPKSESHIDYKVQKSLAQGRLDGTGQIKLIMQIQQDVEKEMQQKAILAKMAVHLKNIVIERNEMQGIIDDTDALLDQDICELRAQSNFIYGKCLDITNSRAFIVFISFCIVANTVVLAMDQYPTDISLLIFIEWANLAFFMTFIFEMVVKMLGLGLKIYFKDSANLFDFIVIVFSVADLVFLYLTSSLSSNGIKAIQALRVFRLLRVFKLAKIWPEFAYILATVGNTLKKISSFSVLLLIFIFSFSILGMELFAATLSFDKDTDVLIENDYDNGLLNVTGRIPNSTYNSFSDAILSVFIVLANDGWSNIYFDHARAFRAQGLSIILPSIYFISLIIIGQNILFQLFLAILLQEFDERSLIAEENKKREAEMNIEQQSVWQRVKAKLATLCKCCTCCKRNQKAHPKEGADGADKRLDQTEMAALSRKSTPGQPEQPQVINDDQQGAVKNESLPSERDINVKTQEELDSSMRRLRTSTTRSLFLFDQDNSFRRLMKRLEKSKKFKNGILLLIIVTSITLGFESPLVDPDSTLARVLLILDIGTTVIFSLEVCIKIIANGLLFNGEKSYLRKFWGILDFTVVLVSIASLSLGADSNLGTLKILRMGRLFRPLRVISRNEGLRISIQALIVSLPAMLRLMMIVALFFVIFAIMGITLFKGNFEMCKMDQIIGLTTEQLQTQIVDRYTCLNYGGEWVTYYKNFNELGVALLQTVSMSQTVGWAEFMYRAMQARGAGKQPDSSGQTMSYFAAFYYIFYIVFGAFFITNLFVGVVISTYNREKDRLGNNFLLSDDQKRWIETKLLVVRVSPKRRNLRPEGSCRSAMFTISEHRYFDGFILTCISLNALVMMVNHATMSIKMQEIFTYANWGFTGVFFVEMVIRLLAFGWNYFHDYWNVFDFTIVIGSSTLIAVSIIFESGNLTTFVTAARLLRIGRLLRLFRQMKSLQLIFSTFLSTLPHMLNVGGILMLIVYIYAVIGISLFAEVMPNGPMSKYLGFSGFYKSFITLIRIATGENWNELMNALSQGKTPDYPCVENPTFADFEAADFVPQGCGNAMVAQVYFISFIFIVGLVFLNLFIAIILQGYYQTQELEKQVVNSEIMARYREAWSHFDPKATGFIKAECFADLMFKFGPPLGWDDTFREKPHKQALFFKLIQQNMKTYENHSLIQFSDVLDAVTLFFIIKTEVRAEMEESGVQFLSEDEDAEGEGNSSSSSELADDGSGEESKSQHDGSGESGNEGPEVSSSSSSQDGNDGGDQPVRSKSHKGDSYPPSSGRKQDQLSSDNDSDSDKKNSGRKGVKKGMINVLRLGESILANGMDSTGKEQENKGAKRGKTKLSRRNKDKVDIAIIPETQEETKVASITSPVGDNKPPTGVKKQADTRKQKSALFESKFKMATANFRQAENLEQASLVKTLQKKQKNSDKKKDAYKQDATLNREQLVNLLGANSLLAQHQTQQQQVRSGTQHLSKKSESMDTDDNGLLNPNRAPNQAKTQRLEKGRLESAAGISGDGDSSIMTDYFQQQTTQGLIGGVLAQSSGRDLTASMHNTPSAVAEQSQSTAAAEAAKTIQSIENELARIGSGDVVQPSDAQCKSVLASRNLVDVINEEDEFMEEELARLNSIDEEEAKGQTASLIERSAPSSGAQHQSSSVYNNLQTSSMGRSNSDVYSFMAATITRSTQSNPVQVRAGEPKVTMAQNSLHSVQEVRQEQRPEMRPQVAQARANYAQNINRGTNASLGSNVSQLISEEIQRMDESLAAAERERRDRERQEAQERAQARSAAQVGQPEERKEDSTVEHDADSSSLVHQTSQTKLEGGISMKMIQEVQFESD